jgi:hypothetical protein
VFPELIRDVEPRSLTRAVVAQAGKALIIAASDHKLPESKTTLIPDGMAVFLKDDIKRTLKTFGDADTGVLALANLGVSRGG